MFRSPKTEGVDLAALFNAAPNPYVVFDRELVIVGCNEAYLRETGRRRDDIVGRKLFDAFPSDPESEGGRLLRQSLAKVLKDGQPDEIALIPYDITRPGEASETRYWSATHTPILDGAGALAFILQHTTDVTEIERLRDGVSTARQAGMLERAAKVQAENTALLAEADELHRLFRQSPSFTAVSSGPQHVFTLANSAYLKLIGAGRDIIGKPIREALPEVVDQGFVELLDEVFRSGKPYIGHDMAVLLQQLPDQPPEQVFIDFVYQPIVGDDGSMLGIFIQGHDVTAQHKAREALQRQSEMLRLAQEAGGVGTFDWDLRTGMVAVSPIFATLYGFPSGTSTVPATRFAELVHPEDQEKLATAPQQSLNQGLQQTEYRVVTATGTRWISRRGTVLHDLDGKPERVVGAVYDLTERKTNEGQLELLAQESAHRIKNMLATVQAIATQTLRNASSITEARDTIGSRLVALGQAQSLLTADAKAAGIRDVVVSATQLHADTFGRFTIEGPNLPIDAKAVLSLGLMLHELSTNAIKYGALSTPDGEVHIAWSLAGDADDAHIDWLWQEVGGPPVAPPERKGFGSRLIERGLATNLGNRVELDYDPAGLMCRAKITIADE